MFSLHFIAELGHSTAAMKKVFHKLFDFFSSLKLAVILIISLATILAVGTFYESEYGTPAAQRVIYHSWFTSLEMLLLIINLTCAAIDRYPWKKHHVGFVTTHAGIITLIMGSFITQQKGIDGNIALGISEVTDNFFVSDTELHIYQSLDNRPFALLYQGPVDFDRRPPGKSRYQYKLADDDTLKVTDYVDKGVRVLDVKKSDDQTKTAAVKFSLHNDRVNVSEWLGLGNQIPPFYDLGPAVVSFVQGALPPNPQPQNKIVIYLPSGNPRFAIYSSRKMAPQQEASVEVKKPYDTGWMNLKFQVDEFFPHADSQVSYIEGENDSPNSTPAIKVKINNHLRWLELDSPAEIKGDKTSYFVSYTKRKYELGFVMALKKFKMGTYGGSQLPSSYESTVVIDNKNEQVISMNEPFKFKGYTIYQSSFETNEKGEPTTSIFSVNYDPGRPIKYAGALCIVCGIAIMFYWKPRYTRAKKVNVS
jgi:hypothetical protein